VAFTLPVGSMMLQRVQEGTARLAVAQQAYPRVISARSWPSSVHAAERLTDRLAHRVEA
jgi:hypothetical protein